MTSGVSLPRGGPLPTTAPADLVLMTLADARLPTGAHTQSAGLEPALRGGLDPADVPAYLAARLRTVTRVDAGTAVVARHVAFAARESGLDPDPSQDLVEDLAEVRDAWAARTPSPAQRAAAEHLGRGYLRLLRRLWPADLLAPALAALGRPPRPLVVGAVAALTGLGAAQTVRLVAYDEAQTIASATLKIAPADPVLATSWVIAAHPAIEAMAADLAGLTRPRDIPADAAPLAEHWAQDHARATERMFSA